MSVVALALSLLLPAGPVAAQFTAEVQELSRRAKAAARAIQERREGAAAGSLGALIMAHGGDPAWDRAVREAVQPIAEEMPAAIAFGMADPETMQEAVSRLEARGVRRIVVVRLFISGDSFKERTERILGLKPGAPPRPAHEGHDHQDHGGQGGHNHGDPDSMPLWRLEARSRFSLSEAGLMDSDRMGEVLASRARDLSRDPAAESVLVIGHGPGDDAENERWLSRMGRLADAVRRDRPYREVRVETLREDWPERRREAQVRIRLFVRQAGERGGRAIVIPFRLSGFGPYAEVLQGLEYASDGRGLLPHPAVTYWIRDQIGEAAAKAGWLNPPGP